MAAIWFRHAVMHHEKAWICECCLHVNRMDEFGTSNKLALFFDKMTPQLNSLLPVNKNEDLWLTGTRLSKQSGKFSLMLYILYHRWRMRSRPMPVLCYLWNIKLDDMCVISLNYVFILYVGRGWQCDDLGEKNYWWRCPEFGQTAKNDSLKIALTKIVFLCL